MIVTRGRVHDASELPGYVASQDKEIVGLITYKIEADHCEIVSLNSSIQGVGIGTALLKAVEMHAIEQNCTRLWLITTNDNQPAQHFYYKRDFKIVAIHHDAIKESRKLKPEIPLLGIDGIPIRDEIELALDLPIQLLEVFDE
jgi:ribosomal protein S18 acetylase RimI-like enzyme